MVIENRQKITPPMLARLWGISLDKVIGWILAGELKAINAASSGRNQRPRFLIDRDDIAKFEKRRQVVPPPKKSRHRRRKVKARSDDRY